MKKNNITTTILTVISYLEKTSTMAPSSLAIIGTAVTFASLNNFNTLKTLSSGDAVTKLLKVPIPNSSKLFLKTGESKEI